MPTPGPGLDHVKRTGEIAGEDAEGALLRSGRFRDSSYPRHFRSPNKNWRCRPRYFTTMRSLLRCHSASPRPSTLRTSSAFLKAPCAPRYSTIFSATFLPTPARVLRSFTDAVLMLTLPPAGADSVMISVRDTAAAS